MRLGVAFEPLLVPARAVVAIAPYDEHICLRRMVGHIEIVVISHIIRILVLVAVRATKLLPPVMGAELVLMLGGYVGINDTTPVAYSAAHLRVTVSVRLCAITLSFNLFVPWQYHLWYWRHGSRSIDGLRPGVIRHVVVFLCLLIPA